MINPFRKIFNINKHWGKCCISLEELNNKNSLYWLDKRNYNIVGNYYCLTNKQKAEIDCDNSNNFIVLPQYVKDSRYKELLQELNSPTVDCFFDEAKNEEEAHFRYRCFIDWNNLEISEWYKNYLVVSNLLIDWCIKNNIKYTHKPEKPPKNYIYDGRDLKKEKWVLFYEELKYF